MMAAARRLLYLHGFRSSPKSFKAVRLQAWLRAHRPDVGWCCPQLPPSPAEALRLLNQLTHAWPAEDSVVIGSSLGGFYATALAEARGFAAVLLNPAVNPARDLAPHVGEQHQYHDPAQRFDFNASCIGELHAMAVPAITRPERYAALIAKGDEVLDWREMCAHYPGAKLRLLEGSDHGLSDFDDHLAWLLQVLGLA